MRASDFSPACPSNLVSSAAALAGVTAPPGVGLRLEQRRSLFANGGPGPMQASVARNNGDANVNLRRGQYVQSRRARSREDPPNQWCGPRRPRPRTPPPIGGTPDCPTDKNLPGCPCGPVGTTAACWPGLRANRNVGDCKDGMTTCGPAGEVGSEWGPCVGAVLPVAGATTAAAAGSCFSEGPWHIDNLVPDFITYGDGITYGISTTQANPDGGATVYPSLDDGGIAEPPPAQTEQWSTDELTVDCQGSFTLCYELKSGDFNNPMPSDCSVTAKMCAPQPTFYATANVAQPFPPLAPWESAASDSKCAAAFHASGGYGEMSVLGQSVLCQDIDNGSGGSFVFHRIQYCPASTPNCGQDGSGTFK